MKSSSFLGVRLEAIARVLGREAVSHGSPHVSPPFLRPFSASSFQLELNHHSIIGADLMNLEKYPAHIYSQVSRLVLVDGSLRFMEFQGSKQFYHSIINFALIYSPVLKVHRELTAELSHDKYLVIAYGARKVLDETRLCALLFPVWLARSLDFVAL